MAYVELDDANRFVGVFPLREEIAGTEFYDGVLIPVPASVFIPDVSAVLTDWRKWTEVVLPGTAVQVIRLGGLSLATAKLGTDDGRGDGHIERL